MYQDSMMIFIKSLSIQIQYSSIVLFIVVINKWLNVSKCTYIIQCNQSNDYYQYIQVVMSYPIDDDHSIILMSIHLFSDDIHPDDTNSSIIVIRSQCG